MPLRPPAPRSTKRSRCQGISVGVPGPACGRAARRAHCRQTRKDAAEINVLLPESAERAGVQFAEGELDLAGERVTSICCRGWAGRIGRLLGTLLGRRVD